MASLLVASPLISDVTTGSDVLDCHHAKKACRPSFVFSIVGQVLFRQALHHVLHCPKRSCRSLGRTIAMGMQEKLRWLFEEEALLGCVLIQPYLYGQRRVIFTRTKFRAVASHLAGCPKESCAQLRRSLLLAIRDRLNPVVVPLR